MNTSASLPRSGRRIRPPPKRRCATMSNGRASGFIGDLRPANRLAGDRANARNRFTVPGDLKREQRNGAQHAEIGADGFARDGRQGALRAREPVNDDPSGFEARRSRGQRAAEPDQCFQHIGNRRSGYRRVDTAVPISSVMARRDRSMSCQFSLLPPTAHQNCFAGSAITVSRGTSSLGLKRVPRISRVRMQRCDRRLDLLPAMERCRAAAGPCRNGRQLQPRRWSPWSRQCSRTSPAAAVGHRREWASKAAAGRSRLRSSNLPIASSLELDQSLS